MSEQLEGFYEALALNSPVAIVTLDLEGKVTSCNPAFERLFGYSQSEVTGEHIDRLITTSDIYYEARNYTQRIIRFGETIRTSGQRFKKDGGPLFVDILGVPVVIGGKKSGVLVLYHDITERKRAEESLRDFYSSFIHVLDGIDADVYVADLETYEILFVNRHMQKSFGNDLVGRLCHLVFRNEIKPCAHCTNKDLLDVSGNPTGDIVWEDRNPITRQWYKNSDRAIIWGDGRLVRLQVATDITELKDAEKRLKHMATHDPLTGLPNRMLFQERLAESIAHARRTGTDMAILFLDMDAFKVVNDEHGHAVGDQVLKEAAARMHACLRDLDTVARVSGDEFTFILTDLEDSRVSAQVAKRILRAVSAPYQIKDVKVLITASVGISVFDRNDVDADELLSQADQAMYEAKKRGKNGYQFYRPLVAIVENQPELAS